MLTSCELNAVSYANLMYVCIVMYFNLPFACKLTKGRKYTKFYLKISIICFLDRELKFTSNIQFVFQVNFEMVESPGILENKVPASRFGFINSILIYIFMTTLLTGHKHI